MLFLNMVNENVISRRYLNIKDSIKDFSPLLLVLAASKKRIANIKILDSYVLAYPQNINFQEVFIIFINNIKLDNRKTIVTV